MHSLYINGQRAALQIHKASSYWRRLKGWMFKPQIEPDDALWIQPCNSIHTFFMNFAIDVVFVDSLGIIVRLCENVSPRRARFAGKATAVIELHSGAIATLQLKIGDQLSIEESKREVF